MDILDVSRLNDVPNAIALKFGAYLGVLAIIVFLIFYILSKLKLPKLLFEWIGTAASLFVAYKLFMIMI
jgi:hypothetical protein